MVLGALLQATISFVVSVCPHGQTRPSLDGFSRNLTLEYFSKICPENSHFITSNKNSGTVNTKLSTIMVISILGLLKITNTGLFEMAFRVLTTCHTQYTWDRSICIFFYLIEQHSTKDCSSSSHKYPGTEDTNQNRHWNHHRWHATNSLERTRLSCWSL